MSTVNDIAFLAGSEPRVEILRLLGEDGAQTRRELRRNCDSTNVTLARNLEKLQEQGWIEKVDRSYELTLQGAAVVSQFFDLHETIEQVNRLDEFLQWVPKSELDLDLGAIADAEITVGAKHQPFAPVRAHVEFLKDTTWARILYQPIGLEILKNRESERIIGEDADYEVILPGDLVRSLTTNGACRRVIEWLEANDGSSVSVYDGEFPFCLVVTKERVQITVHDDCNHPRAVIESDAEEVHTWAEEKFQAIAETARPLAESESF